MSLQTNFFTDLYHSNLECIWNALLPAPDVCIMRQDGTFQKVNLTFQETAKHYLRNLALLTGSLVALPFTWTADALLGQVSKKTLPLREEAHIPEAFGFANSGFQDGAIGTSYDPSSLKGVGTCDWDKILNRPPQRVTQNGAKIGETTHGITLLEGERIEDLFVNIIDFPEQFATLLRDLGCNAYRISLERSVLEPVSERYNNVAVQKYQALFEALQEKGIEPWVTLHHFTNPQWFEEAGGFEVSKNIPGFVAYCNAMVDFFPMVKNWMTFNEPGIRGLEAYVRGEHPPQKKEISTAAQVIRNLLIAHTQAFATMKQKKPELNIGLTHQWLKFLPFGGNSIEKIVAFFFTNLIHTPLFNFFKDGVLHIKIPFKANVQLRYESTVTKKFADFLGVQAYGFPRVKVGFNRGIPYPGAADKVNNFVLPFLGIGFTAGSTCKEGGSMQYFGPPSNPGDLVDVLEEARLIKHRGRVDYIGVTEEGSDAKRMKFGQRNIQVDNRAQAEALREIFKVTSRYRLRCLFLWTLNRHCEWLSGGMPHLGVTKLVNKADGTIGYEETEALTEVRNQFIAFRERAQKKES